MSTKEVDASARSASSAPTSARRGLRGFADRWPFQRKLNVLVGIPLTVIALLLAYLIVDLVQESNRAENAAQLVRDSAQVAQLVATLQDEHQQAILLSVRYEASLDGGAPSTDAYRKAQVAVDAQVQKVVDAFGGRLPDTEVQALKDVQGLAGLRATIEQGYLPATNIDPAYSGAADGLIDGLGLDRNADLATTFTGNLLDSLLRADAAHGAFETGVFSARTGDSNALIEFTGSVGSYELFTYQAERFGRFASEAQADEFGGIEHNASQASIGQHYAELAVDPSALQAESKGQIRAAFRAAIASYPDYSKQAETRLKITASLIDQIADRADDTAGSAKWRAGLLLTLALLCFAVWIAFSILVRRSVVRPVLALTGAAQEVADVAGRELARVADDDAEESGSPRLRRLPVTADDEIGELAEAFNNVQTTAAALLERQVLSRRNVAEMFGNVGRRVSNLTTRQLALIDAVERGETDPALLERLYSIDHIAVRLRRNADSLMLLAGIRETVLDSGPTALTNVVRAALGQIEGFRRVRLRAATEAMVEPELIGDLTLMIAELLENAVSFSPADSPVEVVVSSDHDSASVTVADHGLGMSAERIAEENARLVRRERLDVVPTKVLGLFVVGALARRWDVDVTLSRTPGGGVTAEVLIPSTLLQPANALEQPGRSADADAGGAPAAPAVPAALAAPSAPAAGPSPSASIPAPTPAKVPSWATKEEETTSLPRRVPRRDTPPSEQETEAPAPVSAEPVHAHAPGIPTPRAAEPPLHTHAEATPGPHTRTPTAHPTLTTTTEPWPTHPTGPQPTAGAPSASAGPLPPARTPEQPTHTYPATSETDLDHATGPQPTARTPEQSSHTYPATSGNSLDHATGPQAAAGAPSPAGPQPTARTPEQPTHTYPATSGNDLDHATGPQAAAGAPSPAGPQPTARTPEQPTHTYPATSGNDLGRPTEPRPASGTPSGPAGPQPTAGAPSAPAGADPFAVGPDGSRPLRRRVRGATLRTTVDAAAQQAARQTARPVDADAVRDALDEFEAAVARAHRDTGEHPRPTEGPPAREYDRQGDPRHDHRPDVSPDRTDRTAPSDPSDRPGQITDQVTEPISVADTPHHQIHQNHTPEGAEQ
ncbi:HAMP domain-containing protein [Streptomyces sp. ME02-8801-2C]|uniref:sensor histidine kinase n=1 Tax=Streptomyces sp. ME02-8801-2C TaxID=3028680 RepID=UPI0029A2DADF|nr:ATP-binding protein [Streptomyces sp. ME02-8801-2C]MDX3453959.1 HAMP domain-containing protein [Streptomyces sp. ME02-8801-2C]